MRRHLHIVFVLLAFAAFPQTGTQSGPRRHQTVWEPPAWNFPQNVKASVPKEMLAKLRVSAYDITLEETSMEDAAKRFGGTIGSKGDAGDFLEWLCLHGTDRQAIGFCGWKAPSKKAPTGQDQESSYLGGFLIREVQHAVIRH